MAGRNVGYAIAWNSPWQLEREKGLQLSLIVIAKWAWQLRRPTHWMLASRSAAWRVMPSALARLSSCPMLWAS